MSDLNDPSTPEADQPPANAADGAGDGDLGEAPRAAALVVEAEKSAAPSNTSNDAPFKEPPRPSRIPPPPSSWNPGRASSPRAASRPSAPPEAVIAAAFAELSGPGADDLPPAPPPSLFDALGGSRPEQDRPSLAAAARSLLDATAPPPRRSEGEPPPRLASSGRRPLSRAAAGLTSAPAIRASRPPPPSSRLGSHPPPIVSNLPPHAPSPFGSGPLPITTVSAPPPADELPTTHPWLVRVAIAATVLGAGLGGFLVHRASGSQTSEPQASGSQSGASAAAHLLDTRAPAAAPGHVEPQRARAIDPSELPVAREDEPRRAPVAVRGARIRPAVDAPDTGLDTLASIQRAQPPTSEGDDSASGKTASEPEPGAKANLGINSIPASKISLDGRPLGHTPRLGVSVDAGQHVVVFDHPEHGQRSVTVTVKPGQSRVVSVRF